jgi:hypothetical protein
MNFAQAKSVANVYFENMKALNKRCYNDKIKCFFFLQPFQELTEHRRTDKFLSDDMIVVNYTEFLNRLPENKFINDLTSVFDKEPAEIPFYDPAHFNDQGHLIIANEIAQTLLKSKLF